MYSIIPGNACAGSLPTEPSLTLLLYFLRLTHQGDVGYLIALLPSHPCAKLCCFGFLHLHCFVAAYLRILFIFLTPFSFHAIDVSM